MKQEGNELFEKDKIIESIKKYTEACEANPKDQTLFANRSRAYLANNDTENARKDADTAIELSPNWLRGYQRRVEVMLKVKDTEEALCTLRKGIMATNDPYLKFLKMQIHIEKESWEEATVEGKQIAQTDFLDGPYALKFRALMKMAMLEHMSNKMNARKVPVTVLTGFLGSGKTTLLNRILKENHGKKIAVIENEFGAVGVDDMLVQDKQHTEDQIIEVMNGCICCTVRADLVETIIEMKRKYIDTGRIDYIIIETTGMADPAPIL